MQLAVDKLRELLVGPGHITEADFKNAALIAAAGQPLIEVLVDKGLIADDQLGRIIAEALGFPFIRLAQVAIKPEVLRIIPEIVAKKQQVIAFDKDKNGLKVAFANPANTIEAEFIAKKSGDQVVVYYATPRDIAATLRLYAKDIQKTFDELLVEQLAAASQAADAKVPLTKMVDLFFEYAYANKASDIHLEPREKNFLVRFRIDGVLHDILQLPKNFYEQILSRIKVLAKLRTDEHLSAQDGKLRVSIDGEEVDVRVSIVPIVAGEKIVMRLLSSHSRQLFLADLGMNEADLAKVKAGFKKPYGMILSTGPTGCGKTSTIYAILTILNTREKNIASIEDPVEYDIEGVNQIQVNEKTNLTFADGLRSILRQDPDIIFVGEIRDQETAGIAVNSATTGHLVLSTLHTNDAATTLPRLIDMDVEPFLIASTVNTIVGQRLVRKICEQCRTSVKVTAAALDGSVPLPFIIKYLGDKPELRLYQGKGCAVCHQTGYVGRTGIFEVLEVSAKIRALIVAKADADAIEAQAVSEGMSTMLEAGLQKVALGITTLEEVLRAVR